ncbi:hypothetical protein [Nocardiopsis kunsanensis]|uniref:hypothetical protein n=1 Tax=Nocardiopsis kunsanensis TaxID=141693 RepID=UPI000345534C
MLIDIAYAGVCHSDIHTVRVDWASRGSGPQDRTDQHRQSFLQALIGPVTKMLDEVAAGRRE